MKIAVSGAQNSGKSTLVNILANMWPHYSRPEKTYREYAKDNNIQLNESAGIDSQRLIRDFLSDQALDNIGKENVIHDRCILDNLVYTLWLYDKNKFADVKSEDLENFITKSFLLTRESLKLYDIIFWLPVDPSVEIVDDGTRSTCPVFREEIDNIFQGVFDQYKSNSNIIFDINDQPAFIPLYGNIDQKVNTVLQYLDSTGNLIETNQSVLSNLESVYDELALRNLVKE